MVFYLAHNYKHYCIPNYKHFPELRKLWHLYTFPYIHIYICRCNRILQKHKNLNMKPLGAIILLLVTIDKCHSANILAISPFGGKSHYIIIERLLKTLAARGHEVDTVSHFPTKHPTPR